MTRRIKSSKPRQEMIRAIAKGEQFEYIIPGDSGESIIVDEDSITFLLADVFEIEDTETARDLIGILTAWVVRKDTILRKGIKR